MTEKQQIAQLICKRMGYDWDRLDLNHRTSDDSELPTHGQFLCAASHIIQHFKRRDRAAGSLQTDSHESLSAVPQ